MDHREQQQEYRRLKRERAERLAREEEERRSRARSFQLMSRVVISHDEMLGWLRECHLADGDTIVGIDPCEGGWTFVLTKET